MFQLLKRHPVIWFVLLYFVLVVFLPKGGFASDLNYWQEWGRAISTYGLDQVYATSSANYLPGGLLVIWLWVKIVGLFSLELANSINILKMIVLVFDVSTLYLIFLTAKHFKVWKNWMWIPLFLFIGSFYNTAIWLQLDAVYTFFALLAVVLALRRYPIWAAVFFTLALCTKLQAIIFLPIMLLLVLPQLKFSFKRWVNLVTAVALTLIVIILPFASHAGLEGIRHVVSSLVDYYPELSFNAYNFWYLLWGNISSVTNDSIQFGFSSAKNFGLILFGLTSAITLLPVTFRIFDHWWKNGFKSEDRRLVFLICGLISLLFFFFSTQMHERYSHPAVVFMLLFAIFSRNWLIYLATLLLYLANLESVMHYFITLPFDQVETVGRLIAIGFAIVIIFAFRSFYRAYKLAS